MIDRPIGSLWTVAGMGEQLAVILLGPFAPRTGPEFVVAPLYTGAEPGFRQTDEDVRLEAEETGVGVRYLAIWNAGPVLERDLVQQVGWLPAATMTAVLDSYWASLNEATDRSPRVGKRIRSQREAVAQFQEAELVRWQPVAGRAWAAGFPPPAPVAAPLWPTLIQVNLGGVAFQAEALERLLAADPRLLPEQFALGVGVNVVSAGRLDRWLDATTNLVVLEAGFDEPVASAEARSAAAAAAANADYALAA